MKLRFVILTNNDIAIAEFKTNRQLKNWFKQTKDDRPIKKILTGKAVKKAIYLPIF